MPHNRFVVEQHFLQNLDVFIIIEILWVVNPMVLTLSNFWNTAILDIERYVLFMSIAIYFPGTSTKPTLTANPTML